MTATDTLADLQTNLLALITDLIAAVDGDSLVVLHTAVGTPPTEFSLWGAEGVVATQRRRLR